MVLAHIQHDMQRQHSQNNFKHQAALARHAGFSRGNSNYSLQARLSSRDILGAHTIPTLPKPAHEVHVGEHDDNDNIDDAEADEQYLTRYIPSPKSTANLNLLAMENIEDDATLRGVAHDALKASDLRTPDSTEGERADCHALPGSVPCAVAPDPAKASPAGAGAAVTQTPRDDDGSTPGKEAAQDAIENSQESRGSKRGKDNWNKLRVAHRVGAALRKVNEDNKVRGGLVGCGRQARFMRPETTPARDQQQIITLVPHISHSPFASAPCLRVANQVFGVQNSNDDNIDWKSIHSQDLSSKPWYIILPNAPFRVCWDIYLGLLVMYVAAFIPYHLAFLESLEGFWQGLEYTVDASFWLDIIFNFFTAYHLVTWDREGELCFDQRKIAKRYIKTHFLIDVIASFPFYLFAGDETLTANKGAKLSRLGRGMRLLRGLKLLRIYRLQKFVRDMEAMYKVHHGVSRLIGIIFVVMLATHFVGCIWYFLGIEGDKDALEDACPYEEDALNFDYDLLDSMSLGWVCREGLISSQNGNGDRYVASLYWAFSTLTTVGYGDISARTAGEQLFSMLMMLLGVSWYAYIVSSFSTIMSSFDRQNKMVRERLEGVHIFIKDAKLDGPLAAKVRDYFEYNLQRRNNGLFSYDADEILSELSAHLKNEVITHVERDLIERIPFFKGKSLSFVADAIQLFQPMVAHENDYIIKEGTAADEMYFLIKGRAAVFYSGKKVKALVEGSYFGEIGCILGGIRRASIKAVTTCELQCLSKRNFNNLLGEYADVGEELKAIARERMRLVRNTQKEVNVDAIKRLLDMRQQRMKAGVSIPRGLKLSEMGSDFAMIKEEDEDGEEEDDEGEGANRIQDDSESGNESKNTALIKASPTDTSTTTTSPGESSEELEERHKGAAEQAKSGEYGSSPLHNGITLDDRRNATLARELSVTSAVVGNIHKAIDPETLRKMNDFHQPSEDFGVQPKKNGYNEEISSSSPSFGGAAPGKRFKNAEIITEVNRLIEMRIDSIADDLLKTVEINMLAMLNKAMGSRK